MLTRLRTGGPGDTEGVRLLLEASYPHFWKTVYEPALLETVLPHVTRPNPSLFQSKRFYVAESPDGRIVGCGGWSREPPGSAMTVEGEAHLRLFATHPEWAGKGIGRSLFDQCVQQARNEQVWRLECWASLNARGFYRALGFSEDLQRFLHIAGKELEVVVMQRSLLGR